MITGQQSCNLISTDVLYGVGLKLDPKSSL